MRLREVALSDQKGANKAFFWIDYDPVTSEYVLIERTERYVLTGNYPGWGYTAQTREIDRFFNLLIADLELQRKLPEQTLDVVSGEMWVVSQTIQDLYEDFLNPKKREVKEDSECESCYCDNCIPYVNFADDLPVASYKICR